MQLFRPEFYTEPYLAVRCSTNEEVMIAFAEMNKIEAKWSTREHWKTITNRAFVFGWGTNHIDILPNFPETAFKDALAVPGIQSIFNLPTRSPHIGTK